MLFFGSFRAFFHATLSPNVEVACLTPPPGIAALGPFGVSKINTAILIVSGSSVTWAHRAMSLGSFKHAIDALLTTIGLGIVFLYLQFMEYSEVNFNYTDGAFARAFFTLTGLHGCHVLVGVCFLAIRMIRLVRRHFLRTHYLGFVFATWYWHFVDIV
jgi:cytochrome c oxidase subunit 3